MGNIYNKLKFVLKIKNNRIKTLGIWLFHITGRRYLNVYFDPILGCNLRCQMCYFSDETVAKSMKGRLAIADCELIANALFSRTLKIQFGCGAEPTIYKELPQLIKMADERQVPYISLVTNGNLLTESLLKEYVECGLDELTLSCHGFKKSTYENLMERSSFEKFENVLSYINEIKKTHPNFVFRINFTINDDNYNDLKLIWNVINKNNLNVLQIRPVQDMGSSKYKNFNLKNIKTAYNETILPVVEACRKNNIFCLYPSPENLDIIENSDEEQEMYNPLTQFSYCNISPRKCWKDDFDYKNDTFSSYAKKHKLGWKIFKNIFFQPEKQIRYSTTALNYNSK